jgi:Protein of unknown function (DUF559)
MRDEIDVLHLRDEKNDFRLLDQVIAGLAEKQYGVVARWQLLERAGRGAVDGRIARGTLHPIHRGVYAVGHRVLSVEARWMAAVLSAGKDAVLSHRAAGRLWGLLPRSTVWLEVTRASGPSGGRGRVIVHRSALPPDEVVVVDGIPTTSPFRTLFDLAAALPMRRLERAFNEIEVRGLTDRLSIPELLERYPGRRGSVALRALLATNAPGGVTDGELEERFDSFLDTHGLPRPRLNADLALRGRHFRPDCLWREERLIVELDGHAAHGTRRAFERDRERDRILRAEGWQVVHITWRQLRDDAAAVAADLRQMLRVAPPPTL